MSFLRSSRLLVVIVSSACVVCWSLAEGSTSTTTASGSTTNDRRYRGLQGDNDEQNQCTIDTAALIENDAALQKASDTFREEIKEVLSGSAAGAAKFLSFCSVDALQQSANCQADFSELVSSATALSNACLNTDGGQVYAADVTYECNGIISGTLAITGISNCFAAATTSCTTADAESQLSEFSESVASTLLPVIEQLGSECTQTESSVYNVVDIVPDVPDATGDGGGGTTGGDPDSTTTPNPLEECVAETLMLYTSSPDLSKAVENLGNEIAALLSTAVSDLQSEYCTTVEYADPTTSGGSDGGTITDVRCNIDFSTALQSGQQIAAGCSAVADATTITEDLVFTCGNNNNNNNDVTIVTTINSITACFGTSCTEDLLDMALGLFLEFSTGAIKDATGYTCNLGDTLSTTVDDGGSNNNNMLPTTPAVDDEVEETPPTVEEEVVMPTSTPTASPTPVPKPPTSKPTLPPVVQDAIQLTMTIVGVDSLSEEDIANWETTSKEYVEQFFANNPDILEFVTEFTVMSWDEETRRRHHRFLQDSSSPSVRLVYEQTMSYRTMDDSITPADVAAEPFTGEVNQAAYVSELQSNGGGLAATTGVQEPEVVAATRTATPTAAPVTPSGDGGTTSNAASLKQVLFESWYGILHATLAAVIALTM